MGRKPCVFPSFSNARGRGYADLRIEAPIVVGLFPQTMPRVSLGSSTPSLFRKSVCLAGDLIVVCANFHREAFVVYCRGTEVRAGETSCVLSPPIGGVVCRELS